jgi:hypothetical protein
MRRQAERIAQFPKPNQATVNVGVVAGLIPATEGSEETGSYDETRVNAVLTINDVANLLRCSKAHVCNVLKGRVPGLPKLTHFAMGRRKLVRREWLEEWMEANKCR